MSFKIVYNKISQMRFDFFGWCIYSKWELTFFFSFLIINFFNFIFQFFLAWLKLTPSDFHIKQKWLLYKNKPLFLFVTDLGKTLVRSKYLKIILFALQNGWILALVLIFDRLSWFLKNSTNFFLIRLGQIIYTFNKTITI